MIGKLKYEKNMHHAKMHNVRLKCIRGDDNQYEKNFVSREEYEKVRSDCEKWYRLWLAECKKRKF